MAQFRSTGPSELGAFDNRMSKGIVETVVGSAIIAGAITADVLTGGALTPFLPYLISAGAGMILSGIGTMLTGKVNGFATTTRNPISPWHVIYGRARTGGTVVYMNMWGDSSKMLDLVVVLAAHPCQSVDTLLFDQQRIQIDTTAAPGGAIGGTSFTPLQQKVYISEIKRSNGVVTVTLSADIPYLTAGDHLLVENVNPLNLGLNGTIQVAEILSRVVGSPGSVTFTYLSGGQNADILAGNNAGDVRTLWANYGRKVYMEVLLGNQTLGQTFVGMTAGTPYDGNVGNLVSPDNPGGLGGSETSTPNPWTNYCSLQGKTAVFLRLHYNDQYFKGGLPQISFLVHGKNNISDPRTSPATVAYTENAALCIADFLSNTTWGFKAAYGTEIPLAPLISAANTCDEAVPLALGGSPPATEPAYACNGQFDLSMKRGEILQNMLTSCAGRLSYVGGQFVIWPAAYTGVSFAIGSNPGGGIVSLPSFASMAAGPIRWRPTVSIRDLYNGVKGTYISPENKWQSSDFPPYCQDALHGYSGPSLYEGDANLAADLGDRRWLDIQLPFTISASAAQRIAKIELMRRRHFGTGTLTLNMAAYQIAPLDIIYATIPYLGWNQKQLEVVASRLKLAEQSSSGAALAVEIDVQETDASVYQWSTSEELSPQGYQQPAIPGIGSLDFFATEGTPGFAFPFPWSPGYVAPLDGDAVYPAGHRGPGGFGTQVQYGVDAQGGPTAKLLIKGTPPVNGLAAIQAPQISCIPGTGGSLAAGQYVVVASARNSATPYQNGPFSVPITLTVAANGSIAVTVIWPDGSNGGDIFVASGRAANGFHFQQTLAAGVTSVTISAFDQSTAGGPDASFDHFATTWKRVIHGGVWAQQVQAVTANTITIAGAGMTTNQWAGCVATLLGKLDPTRELPILNMPVASSSASAGIPAEFILTIGPNSAGAQLPDLRTLLVVGDLIVMRMKPTFTADTFQDLNIANPYYPTGDVGIEAGHLVMVLTGPDAGDVQTIGSVSVDGNGNSTIVNLAAPWKVQPTPGDIVIVVEADWQPEVQTDSIAVPNSAALSGVVASPNIANLANQTWIFMVRTETADDLSGPDGLAPVREIFIFGSQGTRVIYASTTMLITDGLVACDTTAGNITYTCLPTTQVPNQEIAIEKISGDANTVTVLPYQGPPADTLPGGATQIVLTDAGPNSTTVLKFNG